MKDNKNAVIITPEDTDPITINLGIDFDLIEQEIDPMLIDFDDQANGEIVTSEIPFESYNDNGEIDVSQLNLLFDPDSDDDPDLSRTKKRFNSDSDPDLNLDIDLEFDFSPPNPRMFRYETTIPEICVLTSKNCNLNIQSITNSLSGFYTAETKVIEGGICAIPAKAEN